jgi:LysM repeat protein
MENSGVSDMVTATESKLEQLDLDTISEYVRESKPRPHDLPGGSTVKGGAAAQTAEIRLTPQPALSAQGNIAQAQEADVLETLWPGLHHHDFAHTIRKKTPGFYLVAGFFAGVVVVSLFVWLFCLVSSFFTHNNGFSAGLSPNKPESTEASSATMNGNKVIVPLVSTYEVQEGDTLAAIALRNYKHISPRLLDAICRANNLSNADVLNLGQKITLPEYSSQQ